MHERSSVVSCTSIGISYAQGETFSNERLNAQGGAQIPLDGPGWGWYTDAGNEDRTYSALWAKRQKAVVHVRSYHVE